MKSNRSVPQATVIPVLTYPDVRKAVEWLCSTFGFTERLQIGKDHRSQLNVGDGAVVIADATNGRVSPPQHNAITHQVMVRINNAKTHCDNARSHGAKITMAVTEFDYGERVYEVEDFAGHHWIFTETMRDVNPKEWGGLLKS